MEDLEKSRTITGPKLLRVARGVLTLVLAGILMACALSYVETALERRHRPAGFVHGVIQGVLMPIAMPNLALGNDVPIYAANNSGRPYKLGYTVGVNVCGLAFFGALFWRIRKFRIS